MLTYFDRYRLLHDKPVQNGDPETSENSPMYTALYLFLIRAYSYTSANVCVELWDFKLKCFKPTPVTVPPIHMSHDNMTGVACMLYKSGLVLKVPIFSRERPHPRDIIFYGYLQYPILFWPLLWIPSTAMIVSCAQTYKKRGENVMLRTDGKLLTLLRCRTVSMPITFAICTWLIKRNPLFKSWKNVAYIYFRGQKDHPIVEILDHLDDKGEI